MSFTESNTVEQMILDAVDAPGRGAAVRGARSATALRLGRFARRRAAPGALDLCPGRQRPAPARRRDGGAVGARGAHPAQSRNRRPARPRRRGDLRLRAILLSVQADGLVRANENFMAWLRGEKTMPFGPQRRACARAPGGRRQPGEQPADGHQPVDLPGRRGGEAVRRGVRGQRSAAGHRRGQDAHAQRGDVVRRRVPDQRDLREAGAGHVRAERLLLRHRGQAVPLRLHPHAHRHVGAVARRGEPGRRASCATCRRRSRACSGPRWCWTSCRTSPSSPRTRSTGASRSSAATSSTRRPTRSSTAW